MQITLNQAEIEKAIQNYVNEQVNIRDGQEVSIDLRAGRGPEGFTATIDIVPAGTKAEAAKPLGIEKAARATRTPTKDAPTETGSGDGSEQAQEAAQRTAGEADDSQGSDGAGEAQTAQESTDSPAAADDAGQADGEPRQSLFAGLKKPVNPQG